MESDPQPPKPAAGWYPDPNGGSNRRYWDGSKWGPTEPTTPAANQPASTPTRPPKWMPTKAFWIVVLLLIGLIFFVIPKIVESNNRMNERYKEMCWTEKYKDEDWCQKHR